MKRSCDFKGGSPSRKFIILPSLVTIATLVLTMVFIYRLTLQDHVTKELLDFMV